MSPAAQRIEPQPLSAPDRIYSWAKQPLVSAVLVIALSLMVSFPNIRHFRYWQPDWIEQALEWKVQHPLSAIPVEQFGQLADPKPHDFDGWLSHLRKQTYRVTLPLIGYGLGLSLREVAILSVLASLGFSVVILLYFRRLIPDDPGIALLLAISVACSFIGGWGTDSYQYFDGAGYLLLASAVFAKRAVPIAILLAAGGLSDERVILAAPLVYLLHSSFPLASIHLKGLFKPNRRQYGVIAGGVLFIVVRVLLGIQMGIPFDGADIGFTPLRHNLALLPLAWVLVFKGAILAMAMGVGCLFRFRPGLILLLISVLPGVVASLLVWDLFRSLGYTFPALLLCVKAALDSVGLPTIRRVAIRAALISACLPTYHVWEDSIKYFTPVFPFLTDVLRRLRF